METVDQNTPFVELGEKLFRYRDYTAVPLLVLALFAAEPSVASATIGTLAVLAGELLRIWAVAFLGSVSRTRSDSTGPSLVTNGPFAIIRNPVYLANMLICGGFAIYSGVGWLLIIIVGAAIFQYVCISQYEGKLLLTKFGDEYQRYCETVPAWVPARVPPFEDMEWPTNLREAFRNERRTVTAIVLTLCALMLTAKK